MTKDLQHALKAMHAKLGQDQDELHALMSQYRADEAMREVMVDIQKRLAYARRDIERLIS